MTFYDVVQWLIVFGVVTISALYMLGRVAPQWRIWLARQLQQPNRAPWINQIGVRIGGQTECGSCDTCGSCGPSKSSNKN